MTSPGASATTTPFPIPTGGVPQAITDGGNAPVGMGLVNRGDNGGTIWIQAGPAGGAGAVPLGPGGTLTWTDPNVLPYAVLSATATKAETLLLTNQAASYSNPITVAQQLINQGVPSTMLDTGYGTYRLSVTLSTAGINVSQSSTLVIGVDWPNSPVGANVVQLRFDDPNLPDLPPTFFYLTNNNAVEQVSNVWQVPVVAPRLTVTNLQPPDNNNGDAYVQIVGNNRPPIGGFRMVSDGIGTKTLHADASALGMSAVAQPTAGDYTQISGNTGTLLNTGPMTRFTGPVTVQVSVGTVVGNGVVSPTWIDETGRINSPRTYYVAASGGANAGIGDFTFQWNHPAVPVYWRYLALAANSGNYFRVTVAGAP